MVVLVADLFLTLKEVCMWVYLGVHIEYVELMVSKALNLDVFYLKLM